MSHLHEHEVRTELGYRCEHTKRTHTQTPVVDNTYKRHTQTLFQTWTVFEYLNTVYDIFLTQGDKFTSICTFLISIVTNLSKALSRKHNVGFLKVQNGGDRGDGDKFCQIWYVSDLQGTKFYPIWDMSDLQGGFRRSSKNTENRMSVS